MFEVREVAACWREPPTRKGDRVRFSITDVFLPGAEELVDLSTSSELVEGIVVNFSDSGSQSRIFAVIDVISRSTVVVPVDKLAVVSGKQAEFPE